ncbi:MAG: hypothetical protein OXU86_07490 [Thaumarchaeota archaeon]|nr:hypothetical protein [Nitrososphaerota archaeon]MDD9826592.1 hypothetical protein [Nitrososphaerota archaeon]
MARKTRFTSYTAHRGVRLSATPVEPMISSVPQTVVQEIACVTQTTLPHGDVIHVVDDAE